MRLAHWGRILGPVGLVLLAVSVLTIFLAGDTGLGLINIILGLGFVIFYLLTNFGELSNVALGRGTFYTLISAVTTLVLVAGLVGANYLAVTHDKSWDVTRNKIHTLSDDTRSTLTALKEPVEVLAFFRAGESARQGYEELFERYRAISDQFNYKFLDPEREPQLVKDYNLRGNGPRVIVKLGKLDARVAAPTEEELTNALVKVTHATQKKIYFSSGHGEAELDEKGEGGLAQIVGRMANEGLKAEKLSFGASIPTDAAAVVIAGPQKPLLPAEVEVLRRYLAEGGRVLAEVEPLTPSGLEPLLHEYGITVDEGVILDQAGRGQFNNPFAAVGLVYSQHPVVKGFRLVTVFPNAASLNLGSAQNVELSPLVLTLGDEGGEPVTWLERTLQDAPGPHAGAKTGPLTLGAAASRAPDASANPKRSDQTRLIVIGDHDFMTNGYAAAGGVGDGDFALNCLSWLADQAERITIRPREREASGLMLTATQMAGIRFFATELPIGLLALGLAIFFNRRAK